jgi:hypothetical protein
MSDLSGAKNAPDLPTVEILEIAKLLLEELERFYARAVAPRPAPLPRGLMVRWPPPRIDGGGGGGGFV